MKHDQINSNSVETYAHISNAIREIIEHSQYLNGDDPALEKLLADTQALAKKFSNARQEKRWLAKYYGDSKPQNAYEWSLRLPYGTAAGRLNPLALPVNIHGTEDDKLISTGTFNKAYEGPIGCVDGGTIASVYDHLLSYANMLFAHPGFTANLEVRYRNKTPLFEELRFETWVEKVDGKKVFTKGRCLAGDIVCTEARALFINPNKA